ncbi:MAG: bifunctional folylpolyglutamate synthase/dihydrofolate synthase [Solirubrobacterales bacterium]
MLGREQFGMRFGLERMRRVLVELGDPQNDTPAIHVVGTNGKSSTTLLTATALRSQGLTAGTFTSPHLISFRERVELAGAPIGVDEFVRAGDVVRDVIVHDDQTAEPDDRVTQFEAMTLIALLAFRQHAVDVAVVEAGLGGRLDSTNVLGDSRVQVLTTVGIDHTQYLGDTIEQIAREKLAVVRSRAALVSGPLGPAAAQVANQVTDERDARWIKVREQDVAFADLNGEFVRQNASLALVAAEVAYARLSPGTGFERASAIEAIARLARDQGIAGRLQFTNADPLEIRDAAHNEEAAAALVGALSELAEGRPVTLLVAMLDDKPVQDTLAQLLTAVARDGVVVCTSSSNPRSLPASDLANRVRTADVTESLRIESVDDPLEALGRAREIAGRGGMLCVTGSNYLLADLLRTPGSPAGATL